jgi:hypothetical protein
LTANITNADKRGNLVKVMLFSVLNKNGAVGEVLSRPCGNLTLVFTVENDDFMFAQ